jgi:nicotinamide riboside transporter PnuC
MPADVCTPPIVTLISADLVSLLWLPVNGTLTDSLCAAVGSKHSGKPELYLKKIISNSLYCIIFVQNICDVILGKISNLFLQVNML